MSSSQRAPAAVAALALAAALTSAVPASAATSSPNDPLFTDGDQWPLTGATASIRAPSAWPLGTGSGVVIGDVDTGANFGHPDLAGKLVRGANFTACNGSPTGAPVDDDVGHGSMTTGIMVADTNNGQGIAAVAPDASALVVKVLHRTVDPISGQVTGSGCDSDVAAGIRYAAAHGARVINLSIGSDIPGLGLSTTSEIPQAVIDASNQGVAVALAAGNSGLPASDYAQVDGAALVAGALGPDGSIAPYSNGGYGVNIYAPGGDSSQTSAGPRAQGQVISTGLGTSYIAKEGTSFAAPHVAGTLALLMSCGLSAAQARQRILDTASRRNGVPELDAAAAVSGTGHCGSAAPPPPAGGSGPPPGPPPPPGGASGSRAQPGAAPASAAPRAPAAVRAAGAATPAASPSPSAAGPGLAGTDGAAGHTPTPPDSTSRLPTAALVAAAAVGLATLSPIGLRWLRRRSRAG